MGNIEKRSLAQIKFGVFPLTPLHIRLFLLENAVRGDSDNEDGGNEKISCNDEQRVSSTSLPMRRRELVEYYE